MARFVRYKTEQRGDTAALELRGELDMAATFQVEQELDRLLDREGVEHLVLDLRLLSFIDSTGLRLLLQTDARARESGVDLVLVRGTPSVQRVFQLAGLADLFPFADAPPAAGAGATRPEG